MGEVISAADIVLRNDDRLDVLVVLGSLRMAEMWLIERVTVDCVEYIHDTQRKMKLCTRAVGAACKVSLVKTGSHLGFQPQGLGDTVLTP